MTSSDRFTVPVRSAVKSNFTDWCCQNLSKRALNALTVQASTTELDNLFQMFTMRAGKSTFVTYNEKVWVCNLYWLPLAVISSFVDRKIR